jgi:hypothetical protein
VSAARALRPLVPGGEALIALLFGLVHGLAFALLALVAHRRSRAYPSASMSSCLVIEERPSTPAS